MTIRCENCRKWFSTTLTTPTGNPGEKACCHTCYSNPSTPHKDFSATFRGQPYSGELPTEPTTPTKELGIDAVIDEWKTAAANRTAAFIAKQLALAMQQETISRSELEAAKSLPWPPKIQTGPTEISE